MKTVRAGLVALTIALGARAAGAATPDVKVVSLEGAERIEAPLPGKLLAWEILERGGKREFLLMAREDPPEGAAPVLPQCFNRGPAGPPDQAAVRMFRFDPVGRAVRPVGQTLPPGCRRFLIGSVPGEPGPTVVLACADGLHRMDPESGAIAPLFHDEDVAAGTFAGSCGPAAPVLPPLQMLGAARLYGVDPAGAWGRLADVTLPLQVARDDRGFDLKAPLLRRVGSAQDPCLYALGPQPVGSRRMRTLLIDPLSGAAAAEWWSQFPASELALESAYLRLDGRPVLMVSSRPADKLSFFGEKLLRLFPLGEKDRSRTGAAPILAVESHANLWQGMLPVPIDLDGDGRQDLVTAYWKGLRSAKVALDAWMRRPDGSFATSPLSTEIDAGDGDKGTMLYGDDLDGDNLPDLAVTLGGRLLIYRGASARRPGRGVIETKPAWSIPVSVAESKDDFDLGFSFDEEKSAPDIPPPAAEPFLRALDLDGDGRKEIVIPEGSEPGTFVVVRLGVK